MTIPSDDPKAIVFLQSVNGCSCAKQFKRTKDGIEMRGYDDETRWNAVVERPTDIESLGTILETVSARGDMIAIVGALLDEERSHDIPRKIHGEGASLRAVAREWIAVDVDKIRVPAESGTLAERVETVWRDHLPEALQGVDCWYQLTSSAGLSADRDLVKCRFWFWLDRPVETEILRMWAKENSGLIDPAVYVATQPIYIAHPKFVGMPDPLPKERYGFLEGEFGAKVSTKAMDLAGAIAAAKRHADVGGTISRKDVEPCDAQIESRIAAIQGQATEDSRHFHALGAVCELYALGCDPARIHETVEDLFTRQGREPRPNEIPEMILYASRRDSEGTLTTKHRPISEILTDSWEEDEPPEEGDSGEDIIDDAGDDALTTKNPDGLNATLYLKRNHPDGGFMRWAEQDWEWNGKCWERLENREVLKHRIDRMGGAMLSEGKAKSCAAKVRGFCGKEKLELPGWISREKRTDSHAIICNNGMVFVDDAILDKTTALQPHQMDYFNVHALPFNYDAEADCPTWKRCLDDWFLDDAETKREIQKVFGYLLVPDNRYEKFFVLTDSQGRAGKGTAVQVLSWLLGGEAVGSTSFSGFAKDFGLGSLMGKSVALFNEANAQNQMDVPIQAVDRIKMITGNDMVEVERKGVDSVHQRLKLRLLMSCNRMPNFRDPSGALMKRMHMLEFKQTFHGREQTDLKDVGGPLHNELSGILNWAIEGLNMLWYEDKRFIRPASVEEGFKEAERIAAPMKAFVDDCIEKVQQSDGYVEKEQLYKCYQAWATDKEGMQRPLGREKFFAELRLLCPHKVEQRARESNSRVRLWWGLKLSEEGASFTQDALFSEEEC